MTHQAKIVQPSRVLVSRMISVNSTASSGSENIDSPLETRLYTWYNPPSTSTLALRTTAASEHHRDTFIRWRAAERRKIHSLGREPQEWCKKNGKGRGAATEHIAPTFAVHDGTQIRSTRFARSGQVCRPLRGLLFYLASLSWGSRPRLLVCRASGAQIRAHS